MTLHLRITKAPDGAPPNQTQQTLDERGGSIGRGPGNSWILPDPERILSSRHCEFVYEGGRYQLIDHSTNGTFINGSTEPVGKGTTIPIHHGDEIEVGDYRFAVEFGAVERAPVDSPFAQSYATDREELPVPAMDDPFASDPFDSSASLSLNGASEVMDPLQALDQVGSASDTPASGPWGFETESSGFASGNVPGAHDSISDSDSWNDTPSRVHDTPSRLGLTDNGPAGDAITWPESHPENLIPDDWLEDAPEANNPPSFQALSSRRAQNPPPSEAVSRSEAELAPKIPTPGKRASADVSLGIEDAFSFGDEVAPFGDEASRFGSEASSVAPERPRPGPKPAPRRAHTQSVQPQESVSPEVPRRQSAVGGNGPNSVGGDALIEAMGLDASRLSEAERAELYPLAGRLVREVVSGLMQVLRSRASIKNEFRMNVTTIQPVENNPLKFSADVDEALENIFVRRSPAYKPPLEAVHEGFQEIAEHQLAMIAGMRSAFEHMLQEFNPEHLEPRFKKQQKPSPIPALQQRRYWLLFQEYYQDLNDNIERSFQQVFGDEFVQAYQDQLRRLSAARSSSGKG